MDLPRYHPDSCKLQALSPIRPDHQAYISTRLTEGEIGFPTGVLFVQVAAPEGFSSHAAAPAFTIPGSLSAENGLTRLHQSFSSMNYERIMPQGLWTVNDRGQRRFFHGVDDGT